MVSKIDASTPTPCPSCDEARAVFVARWDASDTDTVADLMRAAISGATQEHDRFKARGREMDRLESRALAAESALAEAKEETEREKAAYRVAARTCIENEKERDSALARVAALEGALGGCLEELEAAIYTLAREGVIPSVSLGKSKRDGFRALLQGGGR